MNLKQRDATLKAWETLTWVFIVVSLALVMVIRIAMGWSRDWQTYPPAMYGLYFMAGTVMVVGWVWLAASVVSACRRSWYRSGMVVESALRELEERSVTVVVSDEMRAAPQLRAVRDIIEGQTITSYETGVQGVCAKAVEFIPIGSAIEIADDGTARQAVCTGCLTGRDLGADPQYDNVIAHRRDDCPVHHDQDDQPSRARVEDM